MAGDRRDGGGPGPGKAGGRAIDIVCNLFTPTEVANGQTGLDEAFKAQEARGKGANLTYSLGLSTNGQGLLTDVLWDGPAFKAGLAPGMTIVAVNGREYGNDTLKDAVSEAKGTQAPIELLVKQSDRYRTVRIDYHGGLLYPNLERIAGKPDRLAELYKAR